MKSLCIAAAFVASFAAVLLPSRAWAVSLLSVDFGEDYENVVQSGFLEMTGESNAMAANATFGNYTVNLTGQGFADSNNGTAVVSAVRPLYRDYYYNNSDVFGEGVSLTVGGLNPNTPYNLTLWSYDADQSFSSTPTQWSPFGDSTGSTGNITNFATPRPTTLADRSTTIQVTTTTGSLDVFGTTTSGFGGTRLNAFKIQQGTSDVLAVDLGRPGQQPLPVQTGYTAMRGLQIQSSATQTIGSYTVHVDGQGFEDTSDANANDIDPSVRNLYRGTFYNNSDVNGQGVKLTIDGVTPNKDYDVKVWSYDPAQSFSSTPTVWSGVGNTTGTIGNITNFATPRPMTIDDYSAIIRVHSTTSTLEIFGTTTSGFGGTRLNAFELNAVSAGIPGDYNNNGVVDAADYVVWRDNQGTSHTLPNDPTGGTIGAQQYNTWRAHFGQTSGSGSGLKSTAVPEPMSVILLLMGLLVPMSARLRSC